jgi:DNA modification methylase
MADMVAPMIPADDIGAQMAEQLSRLRACPWLYGEYVNKQWRHSLHAVSSYPSKMRPQIAHMFIRGLTARGQTVLDPFCGSGTVVCEAGLLGRHGIGVDLSPYAFVLASAKADPPSLPEALSRIAELSPRANVASPCDVSARVREYFHPDTLTEIVAWRSLLLPSEESVDKFLLACLCGILHGGRPGFLSRFTRDLIPFRPIGGAEYRPVRPRLEAKVRRVLSDPLPLDFVRGEVHHRDSRHLGFLDDSSVDLVLTSPPFFATTEFLRHNWLRVWLTGWDRELQEEMAAEFVGERERNIPRFSDDMRQVICESARVLCPGGWFVAHGSAANGLDLVEIVRQSALSAGLTVESVFDEKRDHTKRNRVRRISGESHRFIVMRKPSRVLLHRQAPAVSAAGPRPLAEGLPLPD